MNARLVTRNEREEEYDDAEPNGAFDDGQPLAGHASGRQKTERAKSRAACDRRFEQTRLDLPRPDDQRESREHQ